MAGPTPILKINVEDAAFKRYVASFQKYQEHLKEQPDLWGDVGASVANVATANAALASEIARQIDETRKLADEEKKRDDEADKRQKREAAETKRRQKDEEDAAKRRRKAIQDAKDYGKAIADSALTFGKWAVGGGGPWALLPARWACLGLPISSVALGRNAGCRKASAYPWASGRAWNSTCNAISM